MDANPANSILGFHQLKQQAEAAETFHRLFFFSGKNKICVWLIENWVYNK